jgi:hypothetical protein
MRESQAAMVEMIAERIREMRGAPFDRIMV